MKRCKEYGGRRERTCVMYVNCKRVREKREKGVRGEKIEERREKIKERRETEKGRELGELGEETEEETGEGREVSKDRSRGERERGERPVKEERG